MHMIKSFEHGFWLGCFLVPDAPRNLQLSLNTEEEGVILGRWAPPVHTHGLIREYIVSTVRTWAWVSESFRSLGCVVALWRMAPSARSLHTSLTFFSHCCDEISRQSTLREKGLLTVQEYGLQWQGVQGPKS